MFCLIVCEALVFSNSLNCTELSGTVYSLIKPAQLLDVVATMLFWSVVYMVLYPTGSNLECLGCFILKFVRILYAVSKF